MKASKIYKRAVFAATIAVTLGTLAHAQTTLYTDSFGGAGTALNGTLVQGGTLQTGSVAWSANSPFFNNGTIDEAAEGSAILPLVPVVNAQYTLSMDVLNASTNWIGLGFKNSALGSAGASQVNDRFSNGGGLAWMLYRNNGADNAIELFQGPNVTNPIVDINNQASINFNNTNNLKIVLDTTGAGSTFTADFFVNNVSISNGPQLVNQPISAIQFVGLTYDNTATTQVSYDNFLLTQTITGPTVNEWNVNGGGTFGTAGNWTMGTPTAGSTVLFGGVLTAPNSPATVTLAAPATLGEVQFSNAGASYNLAGPSTLTLNGVARANTIAGNHEISAVIAGTAGLTKTGGGQLTLSANNTYTGTTNVQAGSLRIFNTGAVDGAVNVDSGASAYFEGNGAGGGFTGTFSPSISGAGEVGLSAQLTTETVTFNNAKAYTGLTSINGGTLALSASGTLGTSDGTAASRTQVAGNQTTGKLALTGGIAVVNELLVLNARELAAIDAVHVTSAGSNSWSGNIKGEVGGNQYNIESTSGTLTLSGTISAPDTATRNFVFSGAGNTNVTGKIVDSPTNADGVVTGASALSNVNIIKRGTGTLTIGIASAISDDYWRGTTTIEAGTLAVLSDGSNGGELASSAINVRAGAAFDIDHFGSYSMQVGQDLGGAGTIHAQSLSVFGDNVLSPGDNGVGTLTFQGPSGLGPDLTIGSDFLSTVGARGGVAFDLSGATTVGGTSNDLITGVRNLTFDVRQFADDFVTSEGTDSPIEILVNPTQNQLAGGGAGTYRLINYTGSLANSANTAVTFAPQLQGIGVTRQTLSVSTATAGQINLVVSGTAANLTWNGTVGNNTWDVDVSTNWTGADGKFKDLDSVTFGAGGVKDVVLNSNVYPATVNFSGGAATTYSVAGSGGIRGGATVNVNSGTVRLRNSANNYTGTTTIANGARLEMGTASTGAMVVNGTLAVPNNRTSLLIDSFSGNLSAYTNTRILDNNGGASNTYAWQITDGALEINTTTYDGIEQTALTRSDVSLQVGQQIEVDYGPNNLDTQDIGLYVGAGTPTPNVRQNYVSVYARNNGQIFSRGFDGSTEFGLSGGATPASIDKLFVARTATDVFELGYYENGIRNIVATRTISGGNAAGIGSVVGFYSDVRGLGIRGDVDNLTINEGSASHVLNIGGNLNLAATGTLDLDLSEFGFTSVQVAGMATLAGTLSVNLLDSFMPTEGSSYAFLTAAAGITNSGLTFDLPALTSGLTWDTSDFFTSGVLSVIAAGLAGDFDNDGDVDGRDFLLWQRNPAVGDLADWQTNYGMSESLAASTSAVPEPSTLATLCGSILALATLRRRVR